MGFVGVMRCMGFMGVSGCMWGRIFKEVCGFMVVV